jgi:hypothetical protein
MWMWFHMFSQQSSNLRLGFKYVCQRMQNAWNWMPRQEVYYCSCEKEMRLVCFQFIVARIIPLWFSLVLCRAIFHAWSFPVLYFLSAILIFWHNIGCDKLKLSNGDFNETSKIACTKNTDYNAVECTVSCKAGSKSAIPNFLKIQCYDNKWIRKNSIGKFVELASANAPPQCYSN